MKPVRVALVGMGKIARDQHLPAIIDNDGFVLTATIDPKGAGVTGVPHATNFTALLADGPALDAVVLCTPPQVRYALAALALSRGMHVFLEKPPGATVSEVDALHGQANKRGLTLLAGWHSRFAPGVEPARSWLLGRRISRVSVVWHEDVRMWHPGQAWIWEPGGLGVFDPGINALSIMTYVLPQPFFLTRAKLAHPANRAAPIAAMMEFRDDERTEIAMDLDWRRAGPPRWDIIVETDAGVLKLESGGAVLTLPSGTEQLRDREYPGLYRHFYELIRTGRSDVDTIPLRLVADAFLSGHRETVEPFYD